MARRVMGAKSLGRSMLFPPRSRGGTGGGRPMVTASSFFPPRVDECANQSEIAANQLEELKDRLRIKVSKTDNRGT